MSGRYGGAGLSCKSVSFHGVPEAEVEQKKIALGQMRMPSRYSCEW